MLQDRTMICVSISKNKILFPLSGVLEAAYEVRVSASISDVDFYPTSR